MDLALLCACLLLAAETESPSTRPTPAAQDAAANATAAATRAAQQAPADRAAGAANAPLRRSRQQVPFPPRPRTAVPTLPPSLDAPVNKPTLADPTLAEPSPAASSPSAVNETAGPSQSEAAGNAEAPSGSTGPALGEPANMPGRSALVMPSSPQSNATEPAPLQPAADAAPVPKPETEAVAGEEQPVLPRILPANAERSALRRNQENEAAAADERQEPVSPAMQRQIDVVDPFSVRPAEPSAVVPASGVEPSQENAPAQNDAPASNRLLLGGERSQPTDNFERANPESPAAGPTPQSEQPSFQRNPLDAAQGPGRYEDFGPNQGGAPGGGMQPREPLRTEFDSSGFSGRLLDEPGPIQRTAGEGTDDRRLPPASNDSGVLVPVQPQTMSTDPRRGMNMSGVVPEASPRAVPADTSHAPQADLARGQAQPDTATRLVAELFGPAQAGAGQGGEAASPISLQDVLQRSSQPSERLALVQNYWRMAAVAAEHQAIAQYADILQQLSNAYRAEPSGVPPEVTAALATAQARQQETLVAWAEASSRLGISGAAAAPKLLRPSDLPHAGKYRTEFEHLYANRPAPPRVALLNQLLPYRYQAVQRRADAVAAATDQAVAADEAFRRGELSLTRFLVALRRETEEQLRFLHDVQVYNDEIAEYAISATGGQLPLATLAETLVKEPHAARQPAAGSSAPQVTPGTAGPAPNGFAPEVLPPEAVMPQPAIPAGPQRGGIPTEALPVPNTPSSRPITPSTAPISPLSPGAAIPSTPGGVVQASGTQMSELPGRSILKAISTLPANSGAAAPTNPSTLRPIPQAVRPMSGSATMVPAPFPQPQMAVPLQQPGGTTWGPQPTPATVPRSAPSSGNVSPASSAPADGWRESPDGRPPQGSQPPAVPPTQNNQVPGPPEIDRMTLRPVGQDGAALLNLSRLAGASAAECAANLREAFFAALPAEPGEQPLAGGQLSPGTAATYWWTLLQRLADERSLQSFLIQLDELQNAAAQQARGTGDYTLLAVRTVRFSIEADLATAQAATTTARAMLREVSPATIARLPKQPRLPSDSAAGNNAAGAMTWERLHARHVEAAAVAVAAQAAAVDMARRQWQQGGRPVEEVLDALTVSRQAHVAWLTAVTRYQPREL